MTRLNSASWSAARADRKADLMSDPSIYVSASYTTVLAILLGFAAWRDVATRTIPDGISIALFAMGFAVRLSQGWDFLITSLLMSIAIFLFLLPLCSRGLLGGADLKLLAALAVGLSPQSSLHLLVVVTTIGGLLAAVYLLAAKLTKSGDAAQSRSTKAKSGLGRIATIEFWRIRRRASLPYGIAIAIGTAVVVLQQQGV